MCQIDHKIKHAGRFSGFLSLCLAVLVIEIQILSGQSVQSHSGVAGNWISTVDWFRFTFRINESGNGSFETWFDVPDQESWDIPVDMETTGDSGISFDIYNIRCSTGNIFCFLFSSSIFIVNISPNVKRN